MNSKKHKLCSEHQSKQLFFLILDSPFMILMDIKSSLSQNNFIALTLKEKP